ncbi:MAG: hypothetical protein K2X60_06645 [Xanthobacteraceae bacterium]|nr:hypothetical protein [Xanthobacteraceae bacterium]
MGDEGLEHANLNCAETAAAGKDKGRLFGPWVQRQVERQRQWLVLSSCRAGCPAPRLISMRFRPAQSRSLVQTMNPIEIAASIVAGIPPKESPSAAADHDRSRTLDAFVPRVNGLLMQILYA